MTEGNGQHPARVSVLDLPLAKLEQLETEFGKPLERWSELPSRVRAIRRVAEVYYDEPEGSRLSMPLRELIALVDMADTDDEPAPEVAGAEADPTVAIGSP